MSSRIHLSRFKDSAAIQFMILDLLDNLLAFSETDDIGGEIFLSGRK
jgi:hypothetical protein